MQGLTPLPGEGLRTRAGACRQTCRQGRFGRGTLCLCGRIQGNTALEGMLAVDMLPAAYAVVVAAALCLMCKLSFRAERIRYDHEEGWWFTWAAVAAASHIGTVVTLAAPEAASAGTVACAVALATAVLVVAAWVEEANRDALTAVLLRERFTYARSLKRVQRRQHVYGRHRVVKRALSAATDTSPGDVASTPRSNQAA
jgi:hypothetical protein